MNLFKGRKFEVKVVPDSPSVVYVPPGEPFPSLSSKWVVTPDDINSVVTNAVVTVGVVYAGARIIDTICRISVIAAKASFK